MRLWKLLAILLVFLVVSPAMGQGAGPPPQAERPWWDRATIYPAGRFARFYNIKSDLPVDELRGIARNLDRTFNAYRDRLGELRQNLPASFDVLVFAKRADYVTTLRFKYAINASGSGGMFFSRPNGTALAFWVENLPKRRIQHVAQHEGFHQVAHALFAGNLSPWVNEGLAEFFGEGVMVGGKLVIGQTNPRVIDHIKQAIETNEYVPFRQMILMNGQTWNLAVQEGKARLHYEQAWSMVHFLVYGEGGRYAVAFSNYLRYLNVGQAPEDSFVRAFGPNALDDFEQRWVRFAMDARPSSFLTAMERAEFLAAGVRKLAEMKRYSASLDELREQLREIDFTYTLEEHGIKTELSAQDEALFLIPRDGLTTDPDEPPVFVVEPTSTRGLTRKERLLNREKPVPPTVRTDNLRPNNITTRWIRDLDTNEFTFEIVVKR